MYGYQLPAQLSGLTARVLCPSTKPRSFRRRIASCKVETPSLDKTSSRRDAMNLISLGSSLLLFAGGPAVALELKKGDSAPQFTLPSTIGKDISLADFKGKNVVLYFYNKDFSSGCSLEAKRFQDALPEFEKRNAVVVGVSMDLLDSHKEFCSKQELTFPLLSDDTGRVSASYGADLNIPLIGKFSDRQTFLIDTSGTVQDHWKEADFSMANVKTTAHVDQVLKALDSL